MSNKNGTKLVARDTVNGLWSIYRSTTGYVVGWLDDADAVRISDGFATLDEARSFVRAMVLS